MLKSLMSSVLETKSLYCICESGLFNKMQIRIEFRNLDPKHHVYSSVADPGLIFPLDPGSYIKRVMKNKSNCFCSGYLKG
jgi:hypothetical protein